MANSGAIEVRHRGPVTGVAWSATGLLASASYDGSVVIWSAQGEPLARLVHQRLVNSVRWSPDGQFLAAGCADGHCYVWEPLLERLARVFSRHTDDVNGVAWSPDGKFLATSSEDGTCRIWNFDTSEMLDVVLVHSDHCMSVDWNPRIGLLATCGEDAAVRLWTPQGELIATWPQTGDIDVVRWNPSGELLAIGSDDGTVRLRRHQGDEVAILRGPNVAVKGVAWSPSGEYVSAGSYDPRVTIWNVNSRKQVGVITDVRLWPRTLDWSFSGNRLAAGAFDGGPLIINADASGITAAPTGWGFATNGVNSIDATSDSWIVGTDAGTVASINQHGQQRVLLSGYRSLVNAVAVGKRRDLIATGMFSAKVGLADIHGSLTYETAVAGPVNALAWNDESTHLAVADYTGVVSIFTADSSELRLQASFAHEAAIKCVAWLDGETVVTAATDRIIRIVDVRSGRVLRELRGHGNIVNWVSITVGERRLIASASRDRTVRIWDADSAECLHVLVGHALSVKTVTWREGSQERLASGSYDYTVRVWDLTNAGSLVRSHIALNGHNDGVSCLSWKSDVLASGSWDGRVGLWSTSERDAPVTLLNFARIGEAR